MRSAASHEYGDIAPKTTAGARGRSSARNLTRAMPSCLGHVAAALHGAPAPAAAARPVVEPRAAGLRGADAERGRAARSRASPQHEEPERVSAEVRRNPRHQDRRSPDICAEAIRHERFRKPTVDGSEHHVRRTVRFTQRTHSGVDRLAQVARGREQRVIDRRLTCEQSGAHHPIRRGPAASRASPRRATSARAGRSGRRRACRRRVRPRPGRARRPPRTMSCPGRQPSSRMRRSVSSPRLTLKARTRTRTSSCPGEGTSTSRRTRSSSTRAESLRRVNR